MNDQENRREGIEQENPGKSGGSAERPFNAYLGDKPFIFVSYSHKDAKRVYPEIRAFNDHGYRVWYDQGIAPGNEWTDEIAEALNDCTIFLVFLTPNSANSENVQNEINYAIDEKKNFLAIHLEETNLQYGLKLQIGTRQAILKYNMTDEEYVYKYTSAFERMGVSPSSTEELIREEAELQEHPERQRRHPVKQSSHGKKSALKLPFLIIGIIILVAALIAGAVIFHAVKNLSGEKPALQDTEGILETGVVGSFQYAKYADHAEITGWEGGSGLLSFPAYVDNLPVTVIRQDPKNLSYYTDPIEVEIPEGITILGEYAFYGLTGLTEVTLPGSLQEIGEYAFYGCTGLTDLDIPQDVVKIGAHAFEICSRLRNLAFPDKMTEIGSSAFQGCEKLEFITLPKNLISIGPYSFYGCELLQEAKLPDSVTELGKGAFGNCHSLSNCRLSAGLSEIPELAFYSSWIIYLTIPEQITTVRQNAFSSSAIYQIEYEGTRSQWEKMSIASGNEALTEADIVFSDE